jgi:hypothetical protein
MKQKEEKPYQGIFIDYVNSEFNRTDIFKMIDQIAEYFDFDKDFYSKKRIKSLLDKKILDDYQPKDPELFKKWKRYIELQYERYYIHSNETDEELQLKRFFEKEKPSVFSFSDRHIESLALFFFGLKFFQRELQQFLQKVVNNDKLGRNFLDIIRDNYDRIGTFFYCPRGKTYLGKIKSMRNEDTSDVINFIDEEPDNFVPMIIKPLIYYHLAEFLCSEDWKKLKQCKYCNKFLLAQRVSRKFCYNNDKCHDAYNNRKAIQSGKRKAFMKKKRLEGKYQ